MDRNAYEADSVVVVNRVKPHTAFRGTVESGPTKMLAIGLGKQRGAHSIHSAGWENIHRTIPEAARVAVESGKVAFGLATVENADEEPCKIVAIPAGKLEEAEAPLLEEAKRNLARLPFDEIDVLIVDEIGKNISGDGADPNVTGRYPTTAASGGPSVERMVYLGLTEETGGNANGLGMADVVTERLAGSMDRPSTYMNALTSTTPAPVKTPMVMPTDEMAVAAALTMCAGVDPREARLVSIENTLKLGRIWVSEALIARGREANERLEILEDPQPMRFEEGEIITQGRIAFQVSGLGRSPHNFPALVTTDVVPFSVVESLSCSVQPWNPRHREISVAARLDSSPISGRASGGRRKAGPDTLTAPTTAPSAPRIGAPTAFSPISSSSTV